MAKYYYNGVLLPEIPADVLAQYPYCWIRKDDMANQRYDLVFADTPWYYSSVNAALEKGTTKSIPYYSIKFDIAESAESWTYTGSSPYTFGIEPRRFVMWSNHDIRNGSATATEIYFKGSEPVPEGGQEPDVPSRTNGYLIRSGSILYTVTDGALSALTETEVTASVFQTYGVDEIPDGVLLATLTDPEVIFWQNSEEELPALTMTVAGAPPLPQTITSGSIDLTHASITGIDHAEVDASEDVRFALSFDNGASWKAFDGSAWFTVSDTAPGMLPSTMNAITAQQWAEVATLTSCLVRAWIPAVTSYVGSVVLHYINP